MSRRAIEQLAAGGRFGAALERETPPMQNGIDRLVSYGLGRCHRLAAQLPVAIERRRIAQRQALRANRVEDRTVADASLRRIRQQLRRTGPVGAVLDQALDLVARAAARELGQRPYAEQVLGARLLVQGRLVEMATGEGKTLTAALAAAVLGCCGLPVDIFTVNDYLVRRDVESLRPFYEALGLTVGGIAGTDDAAARALARRCDIVYAVAKDAVFDYLRQRQADDTAPFAGRGLFFAIVDEADSILIDEARTPLILARERVVATAGVAHAVLAAARGLEEGRHYRLEPGRRHVRLTPEGKVWTSGLRADLEGARGEPLRVVEERVEQALAALHLYRAGHDYVVVDDRVQIVDEYTGRILPDRSWQRGLHQLIEAKEACPLTADRETLSSITYPEFFARYLRLAGMSGTLAEADGEMRRDYGAQTVALPTHRPLRRRVARRRMHAGAAGRWQAVVAATRAALERGQAVLIGTRSVRASDTVSGLLAQAGIAHRVLNATQDAHEAEVIAGAGLPGRVTVATNMAGRGTDIGIADEVRGAGGLCVVMTEHHDARRIDRQLAGRCARQGDPGLFVPLCSLDDDLLRVNLPAPVRAWAVRLCRHGVVPAPVAAALVWWAQRVAGRRQRAERELTMHRAALLSERLAFAGGRK